MATVVKLTKALRKKLAKYKALRDNKSKLDYALRKKKEQKDENRRQLKNILLADRYYKKQKPRSPFAKSKKKAQFKLRKETTEDKLLEKHGERTTKYRLMTKKGRRWWSDHLKYTRKRYGEDSIKYRATKKAFKREYKRAIKKTKINFRKREK